MIQLREVSFAYKRNAPVLDKLSLQMTPGHIYGLLGKNGEGKTTLLHVLCGLLFPQQGDCRVMGYVPKERTVGFLQQIYLLPEEVSLPDVTVVEYGRMYAPFFPNFRKEIWDTCIESFEIETNKRMSKMSLGQRKKAAITLALAAHTPLLLMDEPTNGLDIPSKAVFRRLVASSMDDEQTVIISTHQVRDLESLIDSVLIMERRRILLNSSLDEVSKRLFFRPVGADDKVLYTEQTPMGTMGVGENVLNEETPVSLELLFQAVTQQPKEINRIFTR
ncbi:ABC transporter ATP-binding protein [Parabacteroides sp. OttesenSCG-928-O15]|nr:ABC transporter ATP-binding protein [Parabacteroides sp. OttesenSCG-928-O15]